MEFIISERGFFVLFRLGSKAVEIGVLRLADYLNPMGVKVIVEAVKLESGRLRSTIVSLAVSKPAGLIQHLQIKVLHKFL